MKRGAFTLIELLVVIAIIAILIGLLLPAVQKARESAARTQCGNNLKQLAVGLHSYHDARKYLPPGSSSPTTSGNPLSPPTGVSWRVYVLPYIEQDPLFGKFTLTSGDWAASAGAGKGAVSVNPVPAFFCPSTPAGKRLATNGSSKFGGVAGYISCYMGVAGPVGTGYTTNSQYDGNAASLGKVSAQGPLGVDTTVQFTDVRDGTSNTLLVGDSYGTELGGPDGADWARGVSGGGMSGCKNVTNLGLNIPWVSGTPYNDIAFRSLHTGQVVQFALCDASVRTVRQAIPLANLRAAASTDGGETLGLD